MRQTLFLWKTRTSQKHWRSRSKLRIEIHTSSEVTSVDTSGKGCKVHVKTASGELVIEADVVLSAAGVVANIENIGLEDLWVL